MLFTSVRKSHGQNKCTLLLVCENRLLFEMIFTFRHAGNSIENASEQLVVCTCLVIVNFSLHPSPQKKKKRVNSPDLDTKSCELLFSQWPVLSPP